MKVEKEHSAKGLLGLLSENLGVCRIMQKPGSSRGEIAVAVDDEWQGKGIGKTLMQRAISYSFALFKCGDGRGSNKLLKK